MTEAPMTPEQSQTMAKAVEQARPNWRLMAVLLFASLMVNLGFQVFDLISRLEYRDNLTTVVGNIEEQTSPEEQRKREAALNTILLQIECTDRQITQDVIFALEQRGVLEPGDANVILDDCPPSDDAG